MAWIESHQNLADHPKTRKLARILSIPKTQAIGHLHCLWWWALDYADDGMLDRFDAMDIAIGAEWDDEPDDIVSALIQSGFIDQDEHGILKIHDWEDYAGKLISRRRANAKRMKEARAQEAASSNEEDPAANNARATNVQRTQRARVERPDQTKPNQTKQDQEEPPRFTEFYQAYPRKKARADALKAWKALKPDDELAERIVNAAKAQAETTYKGKDQQYIPYPATWLRAGQWDDEIEDPRQAGDGTLVGLYGGGYDPLRSMPKEELDEYEAKLQAAKALEMERERGVG